MAVGGDDRVSFVSVSAFWLTYGLTERFLATTADWIRLPGFVFVPPSFGFAFGLVGFYLLIALTIALVARASRLSNRHAHWISRWTLLIAFAASFAHELSFPWQRHNRLLNGIALLVQVIFLAFVIVNSRKTLMKAFYRPLPFSLLLLLPWSMVSRLATRPTIVKIASASASVAVVVVIAIAIDRVATRWQRHRGFAVIRTVVIVALILVVGVSIFTPQSVT